MRRTFDPAWPVYNLDPVDRDHPLNQGRVAWLLTQPWQAGGPRLLDLVGLKHGTLGGNSSFAPTSRPGGCAQIKLAGSSGYVDLGSPQAFNFGLGDHTFGVWLKPDTVSGRQQIFSKDDDAAGRQWIFSINEVTDDASVSYEPFLGGSPYRATTPGGVVAVGSWARILGGRRGNSIFVYINGLLQATASVSGSMSATTASARVGMRTYSGYPDYFPGCFDDLSIWNFGITDSLAALDYQESRQGYPGALRRMRPSARRAPATNAVAYYNHRRRRCG